MISVKDGQVLLSKQAVCATVPAVLDVMNNTLHFDASNVMLSLRQTSRLVKARCSWSQLLTFCGSTQPQNDCTVFTIPGLRITFLKRSTSFHVIHLQINRFVGISPMSVNDYLRYSNWLQWRQYGVFFGVNERSEHVGAWRLRTW